MKRVWKSLLAICLFLCLFLVCVPQVNAAYNSKYETETAPANYYSGLNLNQTGENFRRDLGTIISANFNHHSYSTNNTVLAETDPDPNHNGNIICFYTGQSLSSGSWNKEHVWAKSHGFPNSGDYPYSDAHHLRPTLNSINSSRGNSDFGEVDGETDVKSDSYGNKWTSSVFEPRDEVKGDVARIMFYMATRYGFDGKFNLTLVDDKNTSASTGNGKFGGLQTLLKWHYQDPVSTSEIYRNNVIYDNWQHNRNPYIDHPEYVDLAWPNGYSSQEVRQDKVDEAIELIGSIPSVLTLEDKATVVAAQNAYNALTVNEKNLVVNYAELEKALNTIQELEGTTNPVDPDPTKPDTPALTEGVTVDFANHGVSNIAWTKNHTFTVGGQSFFASIMGVYDGELRIGANAKNSLSSLDSKYGNLSVSSNVVVLEQQFDVNNSKSLTIEFLSDGGASYGTISGYYILFKEAGSNSYSVVTHQTVSWQSKAWQASISASLLEPKNGHFAVVFYGEAPRAVLSSYTVGVEQGGTSIPIPSIDNCTVVSSVNARFNEDGQIVWAGLRFGGRFDKRIFENATSYGVAVMSAEDFGQSNIADLYEGGSAADYFKELKDAGFASLTWDFKTDSAVVNEQGVLDEQGEYLQFGLVIDDVLTHENYIFRAVIYVEIDGVVYFMNETEASFISACYEYLASDTITAREIELLNGYFSSLE